jgi:uncharacterized protein YodC (DUF2158 family)
MDETFGPGDVVKLKSGGAPMTVREIGTDGSNSVLCYWHSYKGDGQSSWYLAKMLDRA